MNVTASPSRSESNGVLVHAELWKKYSVPSGVAMKPKPLSVIRLMVPFDDMCVFLRVAAGAVSRAREVRVRIDGAEGGTLPGQLSQSVSFAFYPNSIGVKCSSSALQSATVARERWIELLKALKGIADRHSHLESMFGHARLDIFDRVTSA